MWELVVWKLYTNRCDGKSNCLGDSRSSFQDSASTNIGRTRQESKYVPRVKFAGALSSQELIRLKSSLAIWN